MNIDDYQNSLFEVESTELKVEKTEKENMIIMIVNNMEQEDKDIFVLYYYNSKSIKEIAKILNIKKTNKNIPKLVATFVITTIVTGGLVYATGTAIYDKIWKQPETYKVSNEITEKDKEDAINEEDARKKAEEYLRKIGLDDEINGLKLNKSWQENDITWNIEFTKGSMIMYSSVWTSFLIIEYDTIKNIYIKFKN